MSLPEPPEAAPESEDRVMAEPRSRPMLVAFVLAIALGASGFVGGWVLGGSAALDAPGCTLKVFDGYKVAGDFTAPKVWAGLQAIAEKQGATIVRGTKGSRPILIEQDCSGGKGP